MDNNESRLYAKIGKLIKIIDDLRDQGLNEVFSLPRICVLGSQSAGKSSVLESIIGIDCLPRGDGLVTRCPLELRLVHIPHSQIIKPYAEFEEYKGKKIEDFDKIKEMIVQLTDQIAGKKGNIIKKAIKLTVYSNTCPDLTVIDLPGITRVPLHNSDQPFNIEEITKDLCKYYIDDPSTIILCVIQGNMDISTSDGLQMAMEVDPKGNRTIGVLTKVDIMDKGTNCKKILMNEEIPLKNGYVALKNRSQQDINDKISIQEALRKEKDFFFNNPVYRFMTQSEYFGIEVLVEKLKKLFFEHLKKFLPGIYSGLKDKIKECQIMLETFGHDYVHFHNESNKQTYITSLINQFCESVEKVFNSKMPKLEDNLLSHKLKSTNKNFLLKYIYDYNPSQNIDTSEIVRILIITEGISLSGFPESQVILSLLQDELNILRDELKEFLNEIYNISSTAIKNIITKIFSRFPKLNDRIEELMNIFIDENFEKARYLSNSIADMNFNYLHIDEKSISYKEMLSKFILNNDEANLSSDNYYEGLANYVKILLNHFHSLIVRNLREYVPKTIGHTYIKSLKENIRFFLLSKLNTNISTEDYLAEDPEIARKRNFYINLMKILKNSEKVMNSDEDIKKLIKNDKEQNNENSKEIINLNSRDQIKEKEQIIKKIESKKETIFEENKLKEKPLNNENLNKIENAIPKNKPIDSRNQNSQIPYNNINTTNEQKKDHTESNISIKLDPNNPDLKNAKININMDADTAYKLYQNNKQYLPTTQQVLSGANKTAEVVQNSGVLKDEIITGNKNPPKKGLLDPLTSLFGRSNKEAPAVQPQQNVNKKGQF